MYNKTEERVIPVRMKKYEEALKIICNTDNLTTLPYAEWQGCLGAACVMAVLKGIEVNIESIGKNLGITTYDRNLSIAFNRLKLNGIFSQSRNLVDDKSLVGTAEKTEFRTETERHLLAWCTIAGIAGGFIGLKDFEKVS